MEDRASFRITSRLIFGVFVLLFGGLLLLDRFGVLYAEDYLQYWPIALIVLGVMKLAQRGANKGAGLVLTILGGWLLLRNLGVVDLDFHILWPVLLVLFGINLIFGEVRRRSGSSSEGSPALSEVDAFALLGGVKRASSSQAFRGGSATAILGSTEIDLRQAAIADGEAVLDTFAWWGGVEILVPETWEVVVRGIPILAGFEDSTQQPVGGSTQKLVIKGMAVMGGVEIKNRRKDG